MLSPIPVGRMRNECGASQAARDEGGCRDEKQQGVYVEGVVGASSKCLRGFSPLEK